MSELHELNELRLRVIKLEAQATTIPLYTQIGKRQLPFMRGSLRRLLFMPDGFQVKAAFIRDVIGSHQRVDDLQLWLETSVGVFWKLAGPEAQRKIVINTQTTAIDVIWERFYAQREITILDAVIVYQDTVVGTGEKLRGVIMAEGDNIDFTYHLTR